MNPVSFKDWAAGVVMLSLPCLLAAQTHESATIPAVSSQGVKVGNLSVSLYLERFHQPEYFIWPLVTTHNAMSTFSETFQSTMNLIQIYQMAFSRHKGIRSISFLLPILPIYRLKRELLPVSSIFKTGLPLAVLQASSLLFHFCKFFGKLSFHNGSGRGEKLL